MISDNKDILDDLAEARKIMDAQPCKSEWHWNPDLQKEVKIKPDFSAKNMLASLLSRKK